MKAIFVLFVFLVSCWGKRTTPVNTLDEGQHMTDGEYLQSQNGQYRAKMESDGNFVLYHIQTGHAMWSSGTAGKGTSPYKLIMQGNGNLALYDSTGQWYWSSRMSANRGAGGYQMVLEDNGNLVIYDQDSDMMWATDTGTEPCESIGPELYDKETLSQGYCLVSPNGNCRAVMQHDGNFVVYQGPATVVWSSGTKYYGWGPYRLVMTSYGRPTIYDSEDRDLWNTGSAKTTGGIWLFLEDTCELVLTNNWPSVTWTSESQLTNYD
eukprot:TRINITY_DN2565_c0_g1_i1.p1 TRINITY_DN2565_c0_g1~~TRINITY_DN2565_c0_g1_i1.p1  ORF type:complete len:265 (-),score=13.20 TRINITY_DN2565_c0_g1_i1:229-1023(-)